MLSKIIVKNPYQLITKKSKVRFQNKNNEEELQEIAIKRHINIYLFFAKIGRRCPFYLYLSPILLLCLSVTYGQKKHKCVYKLYLYSIIIICKNWP